MSKKKGKGVIDASEYTDNPLVSVLIPVYNEEAILYGSIVESDA